MENEKEIGCVAAMRNTLEHMMADAEDAGREGVQPMLTFEDVHLIMSALTAYAHGLGLKPFVDHDFEMAHLGGTRKLGDILAGGTFKVGTHEFIVLEQRDGCTLALRKDIICKMAFGTTNNFAKSEVRKKLDSFAAEIEAIVGEGNLLGQVVDLTSDDGLDDYGKCMAKASLLTAQMYRQYVRILDNYKLDCWWWLATAFSTATHDDDKCVECVSPRGYFLFGSCIIHVGGVRPFCIFDSDIFVS